MPVAPQNRLPGELALELEGIATEFEADLMYYQQEGTDSETEDEEDGVEPLRPLRNFPAVALITAIHSFLEVRALGLVPDPRSARIEIGIGSCSPCPVTM